MFITFEGIDGCGKTTQANLLNLWLKSKNIEIVLTKEPGSIFSKECQQIRKLLLDPNNDMASRAELLLYLADRAQHIEKCIKPAILENKWVISDRFSLSTKIYQGHGRGLLYKLDELLEYAEDGIKPDVTFILDLPVDVSIARAKNNNKEFIGGDRIEQESFYFHNKLRDGFLNEINNNNVLLIDANQTEMHLHNEIKNIIESMI